MTLANPTWDEVTQAIRDLNADAEYTEMILAGLERLRPQIYINVSGGVAETTVTRGDAEVIHVDWDDVNAGDLDFAREVREQLEKVADEAYRTRLLADVDKVIAEFEEDERARADAELAHREAERCHRCEHQRRDHDGACTHTACACEGFA